MAAPGSIDQIVAEIQKLQAQLTNGVLPQFQQAQKALAALESLQKQVQQAGKLPPGVSPAKIVSLASDLADQQAIVKQLGPQARVEQRSQATMRAALGRMSGFEAFMPPEVRATYDPLAKAALPRVGARGGVVNLKSSQKARQDFQEYAQTLQFEAHQDARRELRKAFAAAKKAGTAIDNSWLLAQKNRIGAGMVVDPANSPELTHELAVLRGGPQAWKARFSHGWRNGGSTALAYGVFDAARNSADYFAPPLTGQRFTRESRQKSLNELVWQGGGTLVGAGVGMMFGNPIAGAAIGGGVGGGITSVLDANLDRQQALRLAGENLSRSMGQGAFAGKMFADAIQRAADRMGTPAAELANAVTSISAVAGAAPGTIAIEARMQKLFGDQYPLSIGPRSAFMSSPFGVSYRQAERNNTLTPAANLSVAMALASSGQTDAAQTFFAASRDPKMEASEKSFNANRPTTTFGKWLGGVLWKLEGRPGTLSGAEAKAQSRYSAYDNSRDAEYKQMLKYSDEYLLNQAASATAGSQTGSVASMLQLTLGQGATFQRAAPRYAALQGAYHSQAGVLRGQLATYQSQLTTADPKAVPLLRNEIAGLQEQLAGLAVSSQGARSDLFNLTVSQRSAGYEGTLSRLGLAGSRLSLSGVSSLSGRYVSNAGQQVGALGTNAAYYLSLANDPRNPLTPEQRQMLMTQATTDRVQQLAAKNSLAMTRIGDTSALGGYRIASAGAGVASAQATGGVLATLTAQNALLSEQKQLQSDLSDRLKEGNLTYSQRLGLMTNIRDLQSSQVSLARQALDNVTSGLSSRYGAQSGIASAQRSQTLQLTGSTPQTWGQGQAAYQAALKQVAILKAAADAEPNPTIKWSKMNDYQQAATQTQQMGIDMGSSVSMSPTWSGSRTVLQARLQRQQMSPFAPGSMAATVAGLMHTDVQEMTSIRAQAQAVAGDTTKSVAARQAALANLLPQYEDARNDQFSQSQTLNFGWLDRLVNMSVNSPSFASRLMPSFADASSMAQVRGLGPMSARIFGSYNSSDISALSSMGLDPYTQSRFAYGSRPGDMVNGVPSSPWAELGVTNFPAGGPKTLSLDTISSGAAMTYSGGQGGGLADAAAIIMRAAQTLLDAANTFARGHDITVRQVDQASSRVNSQVVNSSRNYNSTSLMSGGASGKNNP